MGRHSRNPNPRNTIAKLTRFVKKHQVILWNLLWLAAKEVVKYIRDNWHSLF
jgi:hypothetical protein